MYTIFIFVFQMLSDFPLKVLAPAQRNGFVCTEPDKLSARPETRERTTGIRRSKILHIDQLR